MDPQACWTELLNALAGRESPAAIEAAETLAEWLRRGGFPPRTLPQLPQNHPLQRVIARTVCDQVLQATDHHRADG